MQVGVKQLYGQLLQQVELLTVINAIVYIDVVASDHSPHHEGTILEKIKKVILRYTYSSALYHLSHDGKILNTY